MLVIDTSQLFHKQRSALMQANDMSRISHPDLCPGQGRLYCYCRVTTPDFPCPSPQMSYGHAALCSRHHAPAMSPSGRCIYSERRVQTSISSCGQPAWREPHLCAEDDLGDSSRVILHCISWAARFVRHWVLGRHACFRELFAIPVLDIVDASENALPPRYLCAAHAGSGGPGGRRRVIVHCRKACLNSFVADAPFCSLER
ncbi:hypothetical protein F5Y15DRAFT_83849 [Xylariaceae sp. FL0016]|nr:hypothetical protein F5Y15DRAFT_83849 [Xylariaceae sp. FL0016]